MLRNPSRLTSLGRVLVGSRFLVALALLASTVTACASASGADGPPSPRPASDPPPNAAELEALYRARADSALMRFTEADVRFMTGMIGHHGQALVMAGLAPENGANDAIRRLAARIVNAQRDEISTMQRWLDDRDQPVPEIDTAGGRLTVHGPELASRAPGMLDERQMAELRSAEGREFDRLFLRYMIQHHRGAVRMVRDLFATDGAAQDDLVFRLASDIQVDQRTEIARMERMLEELGGSGTGRPPGR